MGCTRLPASPMSLLSAPPQAALSLAPRLEPSGSARAAVAATVRAPTSATPRILANRTENSRSPRDESAAFWSYYDRERQFLPLPYINFDWRLARLRRDQFFNWSPCERVGGARHSARRPAAIGILA